MLHTAFVVVKFVGIVSLAIMFAHYCGIAVDRWCDFCEGLWEQGEQLKEHPPDNP